MSDLAFQRLRDAVANPPSQEDAIDAALTEVSALINSLTAALESEREASQIHEEAAVTERAYRDAAEARAQEAERERDGWKEAARKRTEAWSEECAIAERKADAAEARAQKAVAKVVWIEHHLDVCIAQRRKAEAVVEAARETRHLYGKLDAALTAYDEPPTRLGGIEGKHYAVGGRDEPPTTGAPDYAAGEMGDYSDEQEQA